VIVALAVAALLAVSGDRPPVARPHPNVRTKPAPKPPQPPPPPEDDPDKLHDDDETDTDSGDDAPPTPPPERRSSPPRLSQHESGEITDEQAGAMAVGGLCCCVVFAGALGLVIWLIVRKKPAAPGAAAAAPAAPYAAPQAAPTQAAPFHLSVLAIGVHASAREAVSQQLTLNGVAAAPSSAADRAHLVRELAKALRGSATAWSHFGYGERLDLFDEGSAARSYQLAVDDFRQRSDQGSLSGDASFVVATLVLCTRRQLRGVSSLEDRDQIRTMLEDRAALGEADLMGAFVVWSPPLSSAEVVSRFPEMHALQ
jgi:hypothetical protein